MVKEVGYIDERKQRTPLNTSFIGAQEMKIDR